MPPDSSGSGDGNGGSDRRAFLRGAGGLAAAGMVCPFSGARAVPPSPASGQAKGISPGSQGPSRNDAVAFDGPSQAGILTPLQNHTCFVAFDLTATAPDALPDLMRRWTAAARRLCRGQTVGPDAGDPDRPAADSGEALGLGPARLTLTFGFGPTLFGHGGHDRFGLARHRPAALVDLPRFNGDQLEDNRSGGDLSVQACADDPQVAFHAVRNLARIADGIATLRWIQNGYTAQFAAEDTPRNLMGFKDGTQNPITARPGHVHAVSGGKSFTGGTADQYVWADPDASPWMRGGSYLVARRIRIVLEHWDRTPLSFQEEVFGRRKLSGAPLTGRTEFDPLDLDAQGPDGEYRIAQNAHVRLGSAATNGGAQILRRSYSYNDGVSFVAERWPPWRQGLEYDAGLFFLCYQQDPRTGFSRIFETMSRIDLLNQYATHVASGLFAIPPGTGGEAGYVGEPLFKAAGLRGA